MHKKILRSGPFIVMSALYAGLLTSCADTSCSRLVGCEQDVCYSAQSFYAAAAVRDAEALNSLIPQMAEEVERCYPAQVVEFTDEKYPGTEQGGGLEEDVIDLAGQPEDQQAE